MLKKYYRRGAEDSLSFAETLCVSLRELCVSAVKVFLLVHYQIKI